MCLPHQWRWEPPRWVRGYYVQYGACERCGKAKAREVLLG